MSNRGYYCVPGKRIVLTEATDIIVQTEDGEDRLWGDRWEHLDGVTLVVYRDDQVLQTYHSGEWKQVYSFGERIESPEPIEAPEPLEVQVN